MNPKKTRQPIRSGALTVIMTCVLILLAVLALLSLVSAHADLALASRQLVFAQQNAVSERVGQEWLAGMDDYLRAGGNMPGDTQEEGNRYSTSIQFSENQYLNIRAEANEEGKLTILKWEIETTPMTESSELPEGVEPMPEPGADILDTLPDSTVSGSGLA